MLNKKKCVPCQGGIPPLNKDEIQKLLPSLDEGWIVENDKELKKEYQFSVYKDAISFTNKIAELSDEEGHHPYIHVNFKKVVIILFTHKIDGLHENDFILASKADKVFQSNF